MRPLRVIGLFAALLALVGCSSSSPTTKPHPQWTQEQLTASAGRFHPTAESNAPAPAEKMPLKFQNTKGEEVDLADFRGKKNVVLVVVKGFTNHAMGPFCPGCLAQVNTLAANYADLRQHDAEVLLVFPGPTEWLGQFLADGKIAGAPENPQVPFTILFDKDLKAVKALGIDSIVQARPSTYILDKKGNVVFSYVAAGVDTTYDRPSVRALSEQLRKLNGQK